MRSNYVQGLGVVSTILASRGDVAVVACLPVSAGSLGGTYPGPLEVVSACAPRHSKRRVQL